MIVISKPLFYSGIGDDIKCDSLHTWSKSCIKGNAILSANVFLGCLKFFLPIYIAPVVCHHNSGMLLDMMTAGKHNSELFIQTYPNRPAITQSCVKGIINHKKLKDNQFLWTLLLEEIRSGVYGIVMGNLLLMSICTLCKLNGRINYYCLGLIPATISGLSVLVETKENRTLDSIIFFNLLIEAVFRNMDFFNIVKLTSTKETAIFMIVSALLMHILQNRKENIRFTNFWFYVPHKFKEESKETTKNELEQQCNHKENCVQFALKGTQKFFLLGYVFGAIRKLIPNMLTIFRKPQGLLNVFFNRDNVNLGMFIGAYVGIYRYIMCFLLKSKNIKQKYYGAIAGLIAGATYSISPNLQVLTVGITTLFQIFYHHILKSLKIKNQVVPELIVYMLSHGMLFHNAIMCKDTCPSYYLNMLNTCTNTMFKDMYNAIIPKYFGFIL